jgi:hypothetical protein
MDDVSVLDDGVSAVSVEILECAKVNPSVSQESGELTLKARKPEKAYWGSRRELHKHINVTVRSEIRA